jgi:hypothetical protein
VIPTDGRVIVSTIARHAGFDTVEQGFHPSLTPRTSQGHGLAIRACRLIFSGTRHVVIVMVIVLIVRTVRQSAGETLQQYAVAMVL